MKKVLTILFALLVTLGAAAQRKTLMATLYKEFRPSVITFADGHQSQQSLTNVFLKNASLLYLRGELTMEATMDNIMSVKFDDGRTFININNQLATLVDSVGGNALYRIELFDLDSYERNLKNNVNISNIDFGEIIQTTTVDLNNEEDYKLPVFRHYYLFYEGEYLKVHERTLAHKFNKEKRTLMKRVMALPDFSWQNEESLKTLLHTLTPAN